MKIELVNSNNPYRLLEYVVGGCFCSGPGYAYQDSETGQGVRACSALHAAWTLGLGPRRIASGLAETHF